MSSSRPPTDDVPPGSLAQVPPPPRFAHPGHDFTLQIVMEMQRTLGELSAKVDRIAADMKSLGDKFDGLRTTVDGLRTKVAFAAGAVAAVGFMIGIALAALRFLKFGP